MEPELQPNVVESEVGPIELVDGDYSWSADDDEDRRCFIIQHVGLDYGIAYLQEVFDWMKTGKVPSRAAKK